MPNMTDDCRMVVRAHDGLVSATHTGPTAEAEAMRTAETKALAENALYYILQPVACVTPVREALHTDLRAPKVPHRPGMIRATLKTTAGE